MRPGISGRHLATSRRWLQRLQLHRARHLGVLDRRLPDRRSGRWRQRRIDRWRWRRRHDIAVPGGARAGSLVHDGGRLLRRRAYDQLLRSGAVHRLPQLGEDTVPDARSAVRSHLSALRLRGGPTDGRRRLTPAIRPTSRRDLSAGQVHDVRARLRAAVRSRNDLLQLLQSRPDIRGVHDDVRRQQRVR